MVYSGSSTEQRMAMSTGIVSWKKPRFFTTVAHPNKVIVVVDNRIYILREGVAGAPKECDWREAVGYMMYFGVVGMLIIYNTGVKRQSTWNDEPLIEERGFVLNSCQLSGRELKDGCKVWRSR